MLLHYYLNLTCHNSFMISLSQKQWLIILDASLLSHPTCNLLPNPSDSDLRIYAGPNPSYCPHTYWPGRGPCHHCPRSLTWALSCSFCPIPSSVCHHSSQRGPTTMYFRPPSSAQNLLWFPHPVPLPQKACSELPSHSPCCMSDSFPLSLAHSSAAPWASSFLNTPGPGPPQGLTPGPDSSVTLPGKPSHHPIGTLPISLPHCIFPLALTAYAYWTFTYLTHYLPSPPNTYYMRAKFFLLFACCFIIIAKKHVWHGICTNKSLLN